MQTQDLAAHPSVPRPRSPELDLDAAVPRDWFGQNQVGTHIANGVNLLFPAGERFFVRSVNHYLDRIDDPLLRARIKGFFGQEGRHAREHERVFDMLEAQGYEIRPFLRAYERLAYGVIERLAPPSLCLSTTAACEHFTALLAENALRDRLLDHAHPTMRALLLWHAAEEIEHRAVAYDVLQKVDPGLALRAAGLALAATCLGGFWVAGAVTLIRQDRGLDTGRARREWKETRQHQRGVFLSGIWAYLQPGFHPSNNDVDGLAAEYLASVGLT
jgi:predicted metal-dependent hydrolase